MRTLLRSITFVLLVSSFASGAQDFSITVNNIGIGNNWRAGDVTPIHVTISSLHTQPVSAWVQWEVPDADGDMVLWGRPITLAPMQDTSTWLYAPTRGWDTQDTAWAVRLRELDENKPTGELGILQFSPQSIGAIQIGPRLGSIAVFGTRRLGLSGYLPTKPEVKQEAALPVSGLVANDLPDAWPCYETLSALVWADAQPTFSFRQAQALQDWVSRGGHFILSLPSIGDPWAFGSPNAQLGAFTDGITPVIAQVPIQSLDGIVGRKNNWPAIDLTIRVFGNLNDDWQSDIAPLLWLKDGRVVAIQKTVGFGSVTIVGIDLTNGQLASLGLPESDVLWNRILGKRSDTPAQNTIKQLISVDKLSPSIPKINSLSAGKMIAQEIAMTTTASGKLGIVFLFVVSYLLIAGPLGYYILHVKNKLQWSWVLFVCSAAIFTVGTWFVAASTSGVRVPLKHVTIVDHVFGGGGQRVTGWFSLFLPNFGNTEVSLEGESNNLLLPWTPPDASMTPDFIDKREILVNVSHVPHAFNQPARATTANFAYTWKGILEHSFYDSLLRISPDNPPSIKTDPSMEYPVQLQGAIRNNATESLTDVTIVWVTAEQRMGPSFDSDDTLGTVPEWVASQQSGQTLNKMFAWDKALLESGEELQLGNLHAKSITTFTNGATQYQSNEPFRNARLSPKEWKTKIEMLSLYSHLTPPVYQKEANAKQGPASYHAIREGGRGLDLAQWFSRPCIIVMGFLPAAPLPVTVTVDGDEITRSEGVTYVRWVYPLEQSQ
ncbi:MAG: hypothetical protein H8E86_04210 [Planctomycetes bacterium]|nr:hypothetical protein [Planctomycetota bacterium]